MVTHSASMGSFIFRTPESGGCLMGKRGPAPLPGNVHRLHGETRKRLVGDAEPQPPALPAEPPSYLDADAQAEWVRLAEILEPMGLLTAADIDHLGVYCTAVCHHRRAAELVNASMPLVTARGNIAKHPAMQVIRDQAQLILQFGARFGLSPSDRTSLGRAGYTPSDDGHDLLDA